MSIEEPKKIKVTVIKKLDMREIHPDEDWGAAESLEPICPAFNVGDEFIVDSECPKGFCAGAFVDLWRFISGMRAGANYSWMKKPGTLLTCCTDGFRPVIFKLERLDETVN